MNSILKKIRQSDAFNKENRVSRIKAVILMSLFTFTFLEAEFLFVDIVISHYDVTGVSCNNPMLALEENARILKCRNNILYMLFYFYCWLKNKRQ